MASSCEAEVFKRSDGTWAWRLRGNGGKIIATDGSQGYVNKKDAVEMATRVKSGEYADCPVTVLDD